MFKTLPDKLPVLFGLFGSLMILASFFDVQDITKLQITRAKDVALGPLSIGILFTSAAFILYTYEELSGNWLTRRPVSKISDGFEVELSNAKIGVHFGRLEEFQPTESKTAIVLPANEFFDDECIYDDRSALGAYVRRHFAIRIAEFQRLIADKVAVLSSAEVEKEEGLRASSFGIGTCLFFEQPLNTSSSIVVSAVTTKRARVGLKSEAAFIFAVVTELQKIVADKRLSGLVLPVLGAGHGGLRGEVALFTLILALSEALGCNAGHHIKRIDIVVFQRDKTSKPQINPASVKRILSTASAMFC